MSQFLRERTARRLHDGQIRFLDALDAVSLHKLRALFQNVIRDGLPLHTVGHAQIADHGDV